MPKDNLPDPQSEIEEILYATLKGKDLNSLPATCRISQYQKERSKLMEAGAERLYHLNGEI